MEKKVYSVSDITYTIKSLLEESLPTIWVEGEVTNFRAHFSGHYYFSLKDEKSQLSSVMWRTRAEQNSFELADGLLIRCLGNIRVYEKSGRYQLDILQMEKAGQGALQEQFERLKQKLFAEGLFDEDKKKPIPAFPVTIAIITSPTGAAIEDIESVLYRRAPYLKLLLKPVKVQGTGAAQEIAQAIHEVNKERDVDLIIVGRGGGSLEDLWAFNEEIVARAIFDSLVPVISAVGHEIDFTIADFVADLRAPTPSVAAELAVPDKNELIKNFLGFKEKIHSLLNKKITDLIQKIDYLKNSYGLKRSEDMIKQHSQLLDELYLKMEKAVSKMLEDRSEKIGYIKKTLANLNPENTLARGYSITSYNGKIITDSAQVKQKDQLLTNLSKGSIISTVKKIAVKGIK